MAIGKKTGGRTKGTANKVKQELLNRINEKYPDYCPIEAMCEIAIDIQNEIHIRLQASKEVAQYIYPKLKSVEHSDKDGVRNKVVTVKYWDGNVNEN